MGVETLYICDCSHSGGCPTGACDFLRLGCTVEKQHLVLSVTDTGQGIAPENLRKIVKSFSYFAFDMVNSRMADWQKKKDYETAEQWRERVTSENREKKLNEVIANVRKNFIAAYTTNSLKGTLGVYDTDYGTYPVSIDGLGRIYAKVPAEDADLFKGYWNQIQLVPQYGVIDDQLALLSCEFKLGI